MPHFDLVSGVQSDPLLQLTTLTVSPSLKPSCDWHWLLSEGILYLCSCILGHSKESLKVRMIFHYLHLYKQFYEINVTLTEVMLYLETCFMSKFGHTFPVCFMESDMFMCRLLDWENVLTPNSHNCS